jgi:capsular exopolysaccharide synthesis family protein
VANVWDAMKKHEAEKAAAAPPSDSGVPETAATDAAATSPATASRAAVADHPASIVTEHLNGYAPELCAHHERGGAIAEDFRGLRTSLLALYPDERFCVMITSAEKGEGKSVACLNLAMVLAERQERRTVVVDCDLRARRVGRLMHFEESPGIIGVLNGSVSLKDALRKTVYPNLSILPAGAAGKIEVGELLHRPELDEITSTLRRDFDYVLFDTPPVSVAPDACMLGRAVTDALLVVRMNKTRRETVDSAIRLLHAANIKPVGVVLTHQRYYIPKVLYYHT